jgi:putative heme-binding domain-containing protein
VAFVAVLVFLPRAAMAQRELKDIPPADPELERQSFQVAEGFAVNLFAADPLITKPIQMNFDPQGRLWVATSELYPHIEPGQSANDKVLVLEDRDGDGRSDKTTVFADGLLIPTGVEPGDGGAYIANSTELVHLKDTDGDGRPDQRRVVLSGFGTEDTHHILHTFRWGPDGMLYFNQSIYIHSHVETPWGVRRLNGGGIWQFRPQTARLEVLCFGFVNPWGHAFDRFGQSLATDGAYGEGIHYVFPGATFVTAPGAQRILKGLNPGSPKHCGLEIVSGRHLPDDWQGNAITHDFRGHRVCRFVLSEDGSGFASREMPELIKTSHVAFRPVDVKQGPDGAIYIADWYNPIIQHGEVDFRDPRRDHTHGRIWRVTHKSRPLVERPRLAGVPAEQLLEALKAPEDFTRHQAKRVLKERGRELVPALARWLRELDPADPEYEHHRLEGLWCYQAIDQVEPALLDAVLASPDHRVRAAATRVLAHWHERLANPLETLARMVNDDHPRVRLEAVTALARIPHPRSVEIAMRALDRPVDANLDFALWQAARVLEPHWLPALQAGEVGFNGKLRHLTFALEAVGSPKVARLLVDLLHEGKIPTDRREGVLQLVAAIGTADDLHVVLDEAASDRLPVAARSRLLGALLAAWQQRKAMPDAHPAALENLLRQDDEPLRRAALRLVGHWKIVSLRGALASAALDRNSSAALREAALDGLVGLGGPDAVGVLEQLASSEWPHAVRAQAAVAMVRLDLSRAARQTVSVLAEAPPGLDPQPLFAALLSRREGPGMLAQALRGRVLPADIAKVGLRAARASGQPHEELIAALTAAGKISTGPRVLTPAELQTLALAVAQQGDPARGEKIYRRADLSCMKCHAIAGAGGRVGPDLASIGASAQVDYLIESILQPDKAVKENFHALVVATNDGRLISGLKVRQTERELILLTAEDTEVALTLDSIAEQGRAQSLMPAGLADALTQAELIDLVRFLSELGKLGPYALTPARVVRRWEVLVPTEESLFRLRRTSSHTAADDDPALTWVSAYSTVAGDLPRDDLPAMKIGNRTSRGGFARCFLDVTTPGKVGLRLNDTTGLTAWLNDRPVQLGALTVLDLPRGRQRLTLAIDMDARQTPLRCELADVAGSEAQVQIVGGK